MPFTADVMQEQNLDVVEAQTLLTVLESTHDAIICVTVLVHEGERIDPINGVEALGALCPALGT